MRGTRFAALTLAAAMFVAAGCGSSKTSSTGTDSASHTAPLTQAQLIAQANQICYGVNAKRATTKISSKQAITSVLPQLAAYEQTAHAELSKLVPPASMASDWNVILTRSQTVAEDTAKLAAYANTNPHLLEGHPLFLKLTKAQEELAAAAKRNGLTECAQTS